MYCSFCEHLGIETVFEDRPWPFWLKLKMFSAVFGMRLSAMSEITSDFFGSIVLAIVVLTFGCGISKLYKHLSNARRAILWTYVNTIVLKLKMFSTVFGLRLSAMSEIMSDFFYCIVIAIVSILIAIVSIVIAIVNIVLVIVSIVKAIVVLTFACGTELYEHLSNARRAIPWTYVKTIVFFYLVFALGCHTIWYAMDRKRFLDLNCWQRMELIEITIKAYAFATCFVCISMCVMFHIVGFAIRCIFCFLGWVRRQCLRCVYPQIPAHSQTMDQPLPPYIDQLRKQLQDLSQSVQELRTQVSQLDEHRAHSLHTAVGPEEWTPKQTRSPGQHERSTP